MPVAPSTATSPESSTATPSTRDTASDHAAITAALDAWPTAWADHNAPAVCDLFAPEVVFSFQGGDDRTYSQACAQFTTLVTSTDKTVSYLPPEIESIVVDGDLAAVRLIWTATITDSAGTVLETTREKGLDVFQRQDDGHWQISISYAYPLT
jgi:uncharacterized protein (TIGR02246 family)